MQFQTLIERFQSKVLSGVKAKGFTILHLR